MFLNLSKKSRGKSALHSDEIPMILAEINPQKYKLWKNCNDKSLTIDCVNFFWPLKINEDDVNLIFPDLDSALELLASRFDELNVILYNRRSHTENLHFYQSYKTSCGKSLRLSLPEAKQLYNSLSGSILTDEKCFAVKIENEPHFIVGITAHSNLSDLIALMEERLDRSMSELTPYNPITGLRLKADNLLADGLQHIFFSKDSAVFEYPFPYRRLRKNEPVKLKNTADGIDVAPCCNCLGCIKVCPSEIPPNILYHLIINDETDEIEQYGIDSCILCGRCSIVCPSDIPLFTGIYDYLHNKEKEETDEDS